MVNGLSTNELRENSRPFPPIVPNRTMGKESQGTRRRLLEPPAKCLEKDCSRDAEVHRRCKLHNARLKRLELKKALVDKAGNQCLDCEKTYPFRVYDFHHRKPGKKGHDMAKLIGDNNYVEAHKEAKKCDLLCANCHRLRHAY